MVRTWSIGANWSGNDTFASGNVTNRIINVTKGTSLLNLSNNISWSGTYLSITNTTGYGCPSELTCNLYRNGNSVSNPEIAMLGAGSHIYVYNTSGNSNYSSHSTTNT